MHNVSKAAAGLVAILATAALTPAQAGHGFGGHMGGMALSHGNFGHMGGHLAMSRGSFGGRFAHGGFDRGFRGHRGHGFVGFYPWWFASGPYHDDYYYDDDYYDDDYVYCYWRHGHRFCRY